MEVHYIQADVQLTIERIDEILQKDMKLALSPHATALIEVNRAYLEDKIADNDALFYGINTGFGSLCDVSISKEEITDLQHNLVRSHAAGIGDVVDEDIVRLMLLLKIQGLSHGYSGVRLEVVLRLIELYNQHLHPVIFEMGSLGASGDLAPLAHMSLPVIGEGEVWQNGRRVPTDLVYKTLGWTSIPFQAKEALALLNGTQFSSAHAVWCLIRAKKMSEQADHTAAISMDAFNCRRSFLDERLHRIRPHKGQIETADKIRAFLEGSGIDDLEKTSVQDPYAFRCVPQVHGASKNALAHIEEVVLTEINAVTDNPNVFHDSDAILSGGNFHAQPLALPLDYLSIALAELGSISERRVYQLISGQRGLPAFLTPKPGLHSGLMIAQYTAASIVSQNKQYATPASVDSIVSCNGQEDHVSMAANAATKAKRVVLNLERLLAIEFLTAMQGLDFRKPTTSSPQIEALRAAYRQKVTFIEDDRVLSDDIQATIDFLRNQC